MIDANQVPEAYTELRGVLAERFHVELPEDTAERLVRFHEQILEWNPVAGLVSNTQDSDALWSHSLDSLALAPYVIEHGTPGAHWDIGSGGGFPAVVLALALPSRKMTLRWRLFPLTDADHS